MGTFAQAASLNVIRLMGCGIEKHPLEGLMLPP